MVASGYYPILPNRFGAIQPYVYELSKVLAQTEEVDLFGFGKGEVWEGNLHIQTFPYPPEFPKKFSRIVGSPIAYYLPFSVYMLKKITALHIKNPIDILHIHEVYACFAAAVEHFSLGIPCVCSVHNEITKSFPFVGCDKLLPVSNYLKRCLIQNLKIKPHKIEILPIGVDAKVYAPKKSTQQAKEALGLQDTRVLLFVGRKCPEKGPHVLLDALPAILKENPNVIAVLVGPDYVFRENILEYSKFSNYTKLLVSQTERLGIKKNVLFESYVSYEKLRLYYNAAEIFVCPSTWREPAGIVLLEAMASEKPVVASKIGGISDYIKNAVNGLLVKPSNSEELAKAVNYLLANPQYAFKLAETGKQLVLDNFDFPALGRRCLKIYKETVTPS